MNLRRQPKATLLRSPEEFRKLLTIPFTHIFTADDLNQGYGIVGKGYDMAGVIHEWGLPNDNLILPLCADVVFGLNFPQIMLLSPQLPEADSFKDLSTSEIVIESHPMALALYISRSDDVKKALQTSFIWGLDSI